MERDKAHSLSLYLSSQIYSLFGTDALADAARQAVRFILSNGGISLDLPRIIPNTEEDCKTYQINTKQDFLARLNEKEKRRKQDGVFYTDTDVADFITANAFYQYFEPNASDTLSFDEVCIFLKNHPKSEVISKLRVFDPTVGTGEFLLSSISLRIKSLKDRCSESDIISIISNTYGNDISKESEMLAQLRIFFMSLPYVTSVKGIQRLTKTLLSNFFNTDFVFNYSTINRKFNIIIGNPPYVEYSKYSSKPEPSLGNVYANVLFNVCYFLKKKSSIGFIVPLSIVSTPRMNLLRDILHEYLHSISYLSFADRPDCLFSGVHQKLTIVLANNISKRHRVLSSSYHYWYKTEREKLFSNIAIHDVTNVTSPCIPKIGNLIEYNIYKKVTCPEEKDSLITLLSDLSSPENCQPLYLNMRGCFWMKAFDKSPGSKEYKRFFLSPGLREYILCILNSSLFFLYWIIISDCWHITNKELKNFKVQTIKSYGIFSQLWEKLSSRLEETKVYVGTVQTEYEYKHKLCKDIIDQIDNELAKIYNLKPNELTYIQQFALKYRLGDGA